MASISILKLNYSPALHRRTQPSPKVHLPESFNRTWMNSTKQVSSKFNQTLRHERTSKVVECRATSLDVSQLRDKDDATAEILELLTRKVNDEKTIEYIKMLLSTFDEGRISISPYDTAWVALIKDINGHDAPQFPSTIEWIAQNQLPDGSWGDKKFFCSYDRLLNTLACVVALKSWNIHSDKSEKGISYISENVYTLEDASAEHMTCGFEVIFPALLQRAKDMGIADLPYDAPVIEEIHNKRAQKMKRIPKDIMHKVPTSLLFSLEGLEDLDWDKLLKLQSSDGSFLTSPSSTAFAFMETGDQKCLDFITYTLEKLDGGAPHTFPVDIFGRLWAVDRLQRLGISRYFESEIKEIMSYIYSCWSEKGFFSGRDSEFVDIDDTSMGFRLLRMHGYDVNPNLLASFKSGDKFSCYGGQIIESPSPIYNLYRASQLRFPGEKILEEADSFACKFLQETLASNTVLDKWVISKHLPDEIRHGLQMPWYASLPRVEARYYTQYYAGGDDVWIGKTLYRMEEISNDTYLELARSDFKKCQTQHQMEWFYMQEWYENYNVEEFGITRKELLLAYFLAAASIFEPERSRERVAWAKSQIIIRMVTSFLNNETTTLDQKTSLLTRFVNNNGLHRSKSNANGEQGLESVLLATLNQLSEGFNRYISKQLKNAWGEWLKKLQQGEAEEAELLATTLNICGGHIAFKEDILSNHEYKTLSKLTNKICHRLSQIQKGKELEMDNGNALKPRIDDMELEHDMQELAKLVLQESGGLDRNIKQTFLSVAKTYYYTAYNAAETIDSHIFKVLFEPVV